MEGIEIYYIFHPFKGKSCKNTCNSFSREQKSLSHFGGNYKGNLVVTSFAEIIFSMIFSFRKSLGNEINHINMRVPEGPFKIRLESNPHLEGEEHPIIRAGVCFLQLQTTNINGTILPFDQRSAFNSIHDS